MLLQNKFERSLEEEGLPPELTGPRIRLLVEVLHHGPLRMSALAQSLHIAPRTVTQFVDSLEEKGHLIRSPDPDDRRAILVSLPEGCPETVTRAAAAQQAIKKAIARQIPEADRLRIIELLHALVEEHCIEQRSIQ